MDVDRYILQPLNTGNFLSFLTCLRLSLYLRQENGFATRISWAGAIKRSNNRFKKAEGEWILELDRRHTIDILIEACRLSLQHEALHRNRTRILRSMNVPQFLLTAIFLLYFRLLLLLFISSSSYCLLLSARREKQMIATIIICCLTFSIPMFWTIALSKCKNAFNQTLDILVSGHLADTTKLENKVYVIWMHGLFVVILPTIVLAVLSQLIYKAVRESSKFREKMSRSAKRNIKTNKMLLAVVACFLSCNLLTLIFDLLEIFGMKQAPKTEVHIAHASNSLILVNSSVNFFIYYHFSPTFRQTFIFYTHWFSCTHPVLSQYVTNESFRTQSTYRSRNGVSTNNNSVTSSRPSYVKHSVTSPQGSYFRQSVASSRGSYSKHGIRRQKRLTVTPFSVREIEDTTYIWGSGEMMWWCWSAKWEREQKGNLLHCFMHFIVFVCSMFYMFITFYMFDKNNECEWKHILQVSCQPRWTVSHGEN